MTKEKEGSRSRLVDPEPSEVEQVKKKRRTIVKDFQGCSNCRNKRVKCDLGRPFCRNCTKSKMQCPGYGIVLYWLTPPKFTNSGDIIPSLVAFKQENLIANGKGAVRRRFLEFVKWEKGTQNEPYDTYDSIDRDLLILDNSMSDVNVREKGKTKLLGPFGVFNTDDRSRHTKSSPNSNSSSVTKLESEPSDSTLKLKNGHVSPNFIQEGMANSNSVNNPRGEISNEHLWLSNELRDDALLTAAALNGDSHLLDFMNNISNTSLFNASTASSINNVSINNPQTPSLTNNDHVNSNENNAVQNNSSSLTNPNEFLNLLFHKNHNPATMSPAAASTSSASPHTRNGHTLVPATGDANLDNKNGIEINNLMPPESNILIDPTNQHLYYSNYNNYFYDNPYKLNEDLEIHLHASTKPSKMEEESTDLIEGDNGAPQHITKMPSSIMDIVQSPLQPKLGFNLLTPSTNVGLPITALQIQPLTRYLLNHYVNHVADLMTVLPLTESPWKTIYFPRALMAIGELGALGKTSTAKNALLNALLAVSAFNLQSKFPKNSDSMKYYLNLGIRLRNQASLFIRKLLGSSNDTQLEIETCLKNEKYKDVLCAVMSMISVDLVWGTMQDTNFYIKWCSRVINTKMQHKKKLSSKARILHRIFLSLKIIQDSTCLNIANIKYDYKVIDENGYDINGENFIKGKKSSSQEENIDKDIASANIEKNRINYIVNSSKPSPKNDGEYDKKKLEEEDGQENTTPLFINKKLINTKNHNENFATDALYGLPNSLIKLFGQTVRLLRRKIYNEQDKNGLKTNENYNKSFEKEVDQLKNQLDNWKLDWKLFVVVNDQRNFYSPMHEVTYHHIMSFYYALTIYFNRLIQDIDPVKLQQKVELTLNHLNSIQTIISKENVGIIPLFWQGFIAGCEATYPELQMGYKKWGADIAQYLGSYWGARQIMLEVWRRKRLKLPNDNWVGVVNDWEMNLMLN